MFCYEYMVSIFLREHISCVKTHPQRGNVGTELHSWRVKLLRVSFPDKIRVRYLLSMEIGKAEVHACSRGMIQFIRRDIVAKHIPAVMRFFGKTVIDNDRLWRILQA